MKGTVTFTTVSFWQQDEETMSYATTGMMVLSAGERGSVNGKVGAVHVVRSPCSADYIAIGAIEVMGNLGE